MTDTITDAMKGAPVALFGLAGWSGSGKTTLAEQLIQNGRRGVLMWRLLNTRITNLKPIRQAR